MNSDSDKEWMVKSFIFSLAVASIVLNMISLKADEPLAFSNLVLPGVNHEEERGGPETTTVSESATPAALSVRNDLRTSTPPPCLRDIILDSVPGTVGSGARSFECCRVGGTYRTPETAAALKMAVVYTEVDTTTPGAFVERVHIRLAGGPNPRWCSAIHNVLRTRDRNDPNTRNIRSIDLAIGDGSFHGVGWVEVTSTSDTLASGAGQQTIFRYYVTFSNDDGQTWSTANEVGSYQLNNVGLNYSGDIDLAINDANHIGVLLPFDQSNTNASSFLVQGAATTSALVLLDYSGPATNSPATLTPTPTSIDMPSQPGTQNMIDLASGLGGSYVNGQGYIPDGSPVFHAYCSQGGRTTIYTVGNVGSPATTFRQTDDLNSGYPLAVPTWRNGVMNTSTGTFEVPPRGPSYGLWKRSTAVLDRIAGNRVSDTVFSTEADIASNNPRVVEMFMMNTASTITGPITISAIPPVPFAGDVTSGSCYDYGRQYDQEDRGALVGNTYYSSSIRRQYTKIASPPSSTEGLNQLVVHTVSNPANLPTVIDLEKIGRTNQSSNDAGAILSMDDGVHGGWSVTASPWTASRTGKLGAYRAILISRVSPLQQCDPASFQGIPWRVKVWNGLASYTSNPRGGDYSVDFLTSPSNTSFLASQYGFMTPSGCQSQLPTYDLRFDLTSANIPVQAGSEYVITVIVPSGSLGIGQFFRMLSWIQPRVDYWSCDDNCDGAGTHDLQSLGVSHPRYGDSVLIIPDSPSCTTSADIDGNGITDNSDINAFVSILLGGPADLCQQTAADVNGDGQPDGRDIQPFVAAYLGG